MEWPLPNPSAVVDAMRNLCAADVDLSGLKEVVDQCLNRDTDWVKVSKMALLKAKAQPGLAGPRIIAPSMTPPGFPRPMSPGSAARAPGSHAPVDGVSRR